MAKDIINPTVFKTVLALLNAERPEITAEKLTAFLETAAECSIVRPTFEKPLTRKQAAELLGVSEQTIYRRMVDGSLQKTRIGKRSVRITAASVRNLLEQGYRGSNSNAEQEAANVD